MISASERPAARATATRPPPGSHPYGRPGAPAPGCDRGAAWTAASALRRLPCPRANAAGARYGPRFGPARRLRRTALGRRAHLHGGGGVVGHSDLLRAGVRARPAPRGRQRRQGGPSRSRHLARRAPDPGGEPARSGRERRRSLRRSGRGRYLPLPLGAGFLGDPQPGVPDREPGPAPPGHREVPLRDARPPDRSHRAGFSGRDLVPREPDEPLRAARDQSAYTQAQAAIARRDLESAFAA